VKSFTLEKVKEPFFLFLTYLVSFQEEEKRLWREQHPDSESEESEAEAEVKTRGGRGARGTYGGSMLI
jgi:hypothetical protein